ncbi:hypothetical protein HYC85_015352 [Camellia sinensis]|uniref:WRKY domain-containing protein n=1 Tax=Camellia sinensis TaxID=4442 RepID=A0A7J7H057_CAMSI|nr:hypothetical protein HYC85_015352 [Camellia sinensis]
MERIIDRANRLFVFNCINPYGKTPFYRRELTTKSHFVDLFVTLTEVERGFFISFLDRTRTGHDRFRRGPVTPHQQQQRTHETESVEKKQGSIPRVYYLKPIQRLPHLPHNHQVKNGSIDRKELAKMINFAAVASPPNSFMSSLTGDTDSLQHSMSSAFQITNPSSAGRPPLSKRKCSLMDDAIAKCDASSGRCHCSKKMKLKVKRVVRVPAISVKLADIPADDYSWRKYGQKPIKGSPHPRSLTILIHKWMSKRGKGREVKF